MSALRRQLRAQAVQARLALETAVRERYEAALQQHLAGLLAQLAPQRLAFCWPYRGEADLRDFVAAWLAADARRAAALPVVVAPAQPLQFQRWWPGMAMRAGAHGIAEPVDGQPLLPELLLVPLNAFDAAGYRLGYGGGYFDRTLATLAVTTVGIGFELGRVASCLPQPHDRPLDWLVTEAGCWPAQR